MKHWRYDARLKKKFDFESSTWRSSAGPSVSLEISREEWREIHRWMHLSLGEDEAKPNGHFLLETRGTTRRWIATDQIQLTLFETRCPAPVGEYNRSKPWTVMLNPRLFRGGDVSDAMLVVSGEAGRRTTTLQRPGVSVSMPEPPGPFPQWRIPFIKMSGVEVRVDGTALLEAAQFVGTSPAGHECEVRPPVYLGVRNGRLIVETTWRGCAPVTVEIDVDRSIPNCGPVLVDAWRFGSLLVAIDDQEITLTIPDKVESPLGVKGGDYQAVLKPLDQSGPLKERLENAMKLFLNVSSLKPDEDGDYSVESPDGHQLWVRIHASAEPVCVQVFSVLATDVEPTPGLMEELNAINTSAAYVKVLWVDGGVIAETDLVAESLTRTDIGNALTLVAETVEKYRSILGLFFGSESIGDAR